MLKLKLGKSQAPPAESDNPPTPAAPKPSIKLKLGSHAAAPPVEETAAQYGAAPVKQKRKYTKKSKVDEAGNPIAPAPKGVGKGKKRAREDADEEASPNVKRKSKADGLQRGGDAMGVGKRELKPKITLKTRAPTTEMLKIKHKGKPPPRPPGVGYDSEAEDAEQDPAIESQFVLRMVPGEDCDILRKAIEEKTIGKTERQGGPGVWIRFLDKEARRSIVSVRGHMYAAMMVDLPCVIESMKSWDKRTWMKAADICQMLVVLGPIRNEEDAKAYEVKTKEIDQSTFEYAHGLTPPMHWVRKRRFRPRTSYRKIEEVEEAVDKLMRTDRETKDAGGDVKIELVDPNHLDYETSSEEEEEDEDVEMTYEGEYPEGGDMDAEEMERMMMAELGQDDNDDLFGDGAGAATSHDVAMHALGADTNGVHHPATAETPASTSNAETESADGENDGESEEEEDEIDEETLAQQQELAQQREEIAEMIKERDKLIESRERMQNALFRQRTQAKINGLENDINLKRAQIENDFGVGRLDDINFSFLEGKE